MFQAKLRRSMQPLAVVQPDGPALPSPDEGGEHFPAILLGGRPAKRDFEISTCKTEAGCMFFKPGAPSTASPSHRTARRTTFLTNP